MEKICSDRTYFYEDGTRVEMEDATDEIQPGIQTSSVLNWMLANDCSNPCGDAENAGYNKYDFTGCCVAYRIIARRVHLKSQDAHLFLPIVAYDVKAVYITSN